ncbi:exopolysaccharide biosynthesis polyprenyl glycosylphosphotransferase [Alsobacter sp. R-9]
MSEERIRPVPVRGAEGLSAMEGPGWIPQQAAPLSPSARPAEPTSARQSGAPATSPMGVSHVTVGLDPTSRSSAQVDVVAGSMLCAGLVAALVLPAVLCSYGIGMSQQDFEVVRETGTAAVVALCLALIIVRRILTFPLLRSVTYILIAFAAVYLGAGAFLKLIKLNFSAPQFYLSAAISIAVVETFLVLRRRRSRPVFAVLPSVEDPDIESLALVRRAVCRTLPAVPDDISAYSGIIADLRHDLEPQWERLLALAALRGIPVFHVKQFREMLSGRVAVDHLWENTVVGSLPALVYPQIKRFLDIVGSLVLLPLIIPVIAVAGIAVRLETRGPILFRQSRVGYGGRVFEIVKLRTMTADAEANGTAFTQKADPRITRVGAVLRQYRIDELPQVLNILLGHMSWIGPRPEAVSLAQWYEREIPFYAYRHIVRPGISGWAQVNQGNVAQIDAARVKLEYDFFYIKHFSFWLDAIIVVKTIRTILTRAGAR